ncbi:RNA polymerase sigma factor [Bdellovibrionota bacterium]
MSLLPEILRDLIETYQQMVLRVVLGIVGDPGEADDVAQEVFLKAYKHIGELNNDAAKKTWLYRVAVNQAIDFLRKAHRYREVSVGEQIPHVATTTMNSLKALEKAETKELIRQGLEHLSTDHRVVLILRELEGWSYEEMADILGLPVGTVESRLFRARKALKFVLLELMERQND